MTQPTDPAPLAPNQTLPVIQPTYPAPPYYPPPRPAPKPSFWTGTRGILSLIAIIGGAVIILTIGALALGLNTGAGPSTSATMKVNVTGCRISGGDLPIATIDFTVTNTGTLTRSVRVDIEYRDDAGVRIDTDTSTVRDVAPGDTVRKSEDTFLDASATTGTCRIIRVS